MTTKDPRAAYLMPSRVEINISKSKSKRLVERERRENSKRGLYVSDGKLTI